MGREKILSGTCSVYFYLAFVRFTENDRENSYVNSPWTFKKSVKASQPIVRVCVR